MKIKTLLIVVAGLTLVAATSAWCGHGSTHHGAGMHQGRLGSRLLAALDLSDTQQEEIDDIRDSYASLFDELQAQLKTTRQQIGLILFADEFDEAAIRQACQNAAAMHEDLTVLKGKMIAEIKSVLTDAQVAELQERIDARIKALETLDN